MKTCSKCKELKPISEFHKQTRSKDGLYPQCKKCSAISRKKNYIKQRTEQPEEMAERRRGYVARYRERHPDRIYQGDRRRSLRRKFNMSIEEYDQLFAKQNGKCAICNFTSTKKLLAVDHSHDCCPTEQTCGKCIRGLLCGSCNTALGVLEPYLKEVVQYVSNF